MRVARLVTATALGVALLIGALPTARAGSTPRAAGNGLLLFEGWGPWTPASGCLPICRESISSAGPNYDIWTVERDGSGLRNLTRSLGVDTDARWSPDGKRIVFASNRTGDYDLYVIAADGTGLRPLTDDPGDETYPVWSPDGREILFVSTQSRRADLVIIGADGSGRRKVASFRDAWHPSWSPLGNWIVFTKRTQDGDGERHTGNDDIYLVRPDGSGLRPLVATPLNESDPVWSPDGRWIAFDQEACSDPRDCDWNWDIAAVRPDGSGLRWLVRSDLPEWDPTWSPDGTKIAYVLNEYTDVTWDGEIWIADLEDSTQRRLVTKPDTYDYQVDWQPVRR